MTELEVYYMIITDCWKLFKAHYAERDRTPEEWAAVAADSAKRFDDYCGTKFEPFAAAMAARTLEELHAIEKRGHNNESTEGTI